MTRILVVNPNSTASMTAMIRRGAERVAAPGTRIEALSPPATPPSIEGYHDEAMAVPAMLAAIRDGEARGFDAHVIACFDDPGLDAAREVARGPVVGICQAAVQVACTLSARFSVVTTLPRSVPIIEDLVAGYGYGYGAGARCRRVRAVYLPVLALALEANPGPAQARLGAEIRAALAEDRAEAIVLGCAGMSEFCARMFEEFGAPVIDGVTAAVKLAEALVGAGYRTSKVGAYSYPRAKDGDLAVIAS